ncbi:hypothetical protein H0H92_005099 [Tricholoma furcatifolium]|nr:hypothetical protein H0H92_005099 [Tricholoma furcatifolium]
MTHEGGGLGALSPTAAAVPPPDLRHPSYPPFAPHTTPHTANEHPPRRQAPPRACQLDDRPQLPPTIPQPASTTPAMSPHAIQAVWMSGAARGRQVRRVEGR